MQNPVYASPESKRIQLTVEKMKRTRTNNQNRYYWSCVVGEIAKHNGHDPEQMHELLKIMCAPKWRFAAGYPSGIVVPTSTTGLDTLAFVEYTEKCRMWANEFLGLQIPLLGKLLFRFLEDCNRGRVLAPPFRKVATRY